MDKFSPESLFFCLSLTCLSYEISNVKDTFHPRAPACLAIPPRGCMVIMPMDE